MENPLFQTKRTVRFQDIDAAGIIFFPRVLEYFSDAYVEWLGVRGLPLPRMLALGVYGLPIVHAEADYRSPMRFGDRISVQIEQVELGSTSLSVMYRIVSEEDPAHTLAVGKTVHVCVSQKTFRPEPLLEELRAALSAHVD